MKVEFENEIKTKYRNMFPSDEIMADMEKSCLCWGFECADGWENLLRNLFEELSKLEIPKDFRIEQIKSKFGGLRFYVSFASDEIYKVIDKYETLSYTTCEFCGADNATQTGKDWITTLCPNCLEKTLDKKVKQ